MKDQLNLTVFTKNKSTVYMYLGVESYKMIGFAPTKGLRSKRQLSNLFTVANSHYQLS